MPTYTDKIDNVLPEHLQGFFEGWPSPPTPETHLKLLQNSTHIMLAKEGDEVIGFITAVTDGVLSAHIPFLEVKKDHRGEGIGKELVRLMLMKLDDYYMIDLTCDPALRPFYLSLGFSALTAMAKRQYDFQSGRPLPQK